MTTSTSGKSRPRAATSVQNKTEGEEGVLGWVENAFKAADRLFGGSWPCSEWRENELSAGSLDRIYARAIGISK